MDHVSILSEEIRPGQSFRMARRDPNLEKFPGSPGGSDLGKVLHSVPALHARMRVKDSRLSTDSPICSEIRS
jgi:hypothetical protein